MPWMRENNAWLENTEHNCLYKFETIPNLTTADVLPKVTGQCTVLSHFGDSANQHLQLVSGFNPFEKHESQLGWFFQIYGKLKVMFHTTNQTVVFGVFRGHQIMCIRGRNARPSPCSPEPPANTGLALRDLSKPVRWANITTEIYRKRQFFHGKTQITSFLWPFSIAMFK